MPQPQADHCPVCGKEIGWDDSDWDGDSITLMGTCECGLDVKQFEHCVAHSQAFVHPETKVNEYFDLPTAEDRLDAEVKRLREVLDKCLTQAFKHTTQYWLDPKGTDADRLARITTIVQDALAGGKE